MTWRQTAIVAATEDQLETDLVLRGRTSAATRGVRGPQQNQEHATEGPLTCSLEVGHRPDVPDAVPGLGDEEPGQFQDDHPDHEDQQDLGERDRKCLEPLGQGLKRRAPRGGAW